MLSNHLLASCITEDLPFTLFLVNEHLKIYKFFISIFYNNLPVIESGCYKIRKCFQEYGFQI